MKSCSVLICLFTLALGLGATLTPFVQGALGQFAGRNAVYANGNQLAMVYSENITSNPHNLSSLVYRYSINGGASWTNSLIDVFGGTFVRPTLTVIPGEILVAYRQGVVQKVARSTNNGLTWTIWNMGKTFESSPQIWRDGENYRSFELDLPYPEYLQEDFATVLDPEELIAPQFITDKEMSWNHTPVYFHGADVLHGTIRTNSNIWLKRTNQGTNSGWPTFWGPVITAGSIISAEPIPYSTVFRGGYITGAPPMEIEAVHPDYGQGQVVGPAAYDPSRIVLVHVNNRSYQAWLGTINPPQPQSNPVYQVYPADPPGAILFHNNYMVSDTTWTYLGQHSITEDRLFVNNKLWIKGSFGGMQSWSCSDTIMIIGDILLQNTPAGLAPHDPASPNHSDWVTLISDRQVIMKYGYRDPVSGARVHPLCREDANPLKIYASIYALRSDAQNPRLEGCFTFEYQHPHVSTPDYVYNGQLYSRIDLHRRRFPQTAAALWPATLDLPWYNPLWPEPNPYLERGVIQFWGSLVQRRRGYVHRNWVDNEYPTNGIWNPAEDACGGPSYEAGFTYYDPVSGAAYGPANYPGTVGQGIGYKKEYRGDRRLKTDHRIWSFGIRLGSRAASAGAFNTNHLHKYSRIIHSKLRAEANTGNFYAVNDLLLFESQTGLTDLGHLTAGHGTITSLAVSPAGNALVIQYEQGEEGYSFLLREISPLTGEVLSSYQGSASTMMNQVAVTPNGRKILASVDFEDVTRINFWEIQASGMPQLIESHQAGYMPQNALTQDSRLALAPSGADQLDLVYWRKSADGHPYNPWGTIYHARAVLGPVSSDDPAVPSVPTYAMTAVPNPMQTELSIELRLPYPVEHRVEIYNLRGQKLATIEGDARTMGTATYVWNGRTQAGRACPAGLYFVKFLAAGKVQGSSLIRKL